MANEEHLDILKQGVETWNRWRKENPKVQVDLREADLSDAYLVDADLNRANLTEAYLNDAYLTEANLVGSKLADAYLDGANLNGATLLEVNLTRAILNEANLTGAILGEISFAGTTLTETTGLDACIHEAPSYLDQRTLAYNPHLPEAFLRGCGLSDWLRLLNETAQMGLLGHWHFMKLGGIEISMIAGATITQLIQVCQKSAELRQQLGYPSGKQFKEATGSIPKLRNKVMHPVRPLIYSYEDVAKVLRTTKNLLQLRDKTRRALEAKGGTPTLL